MAIALEFLNLIIPIENIRRAKGHEATKILASLRQGGGFSDLVDWHDDHLYRTGSMGSDIDIEMWIKEWQEMGLEPLGERNGEKYWKDICVASATTGPTLPCDWLEYDKWNRCVYLKGTERGLLVGRSGITETNDECWEEAAKAFKAERFRTGLSLTKALAERGYAIAQHFLGELLITGNYNGRRILCDLEPEQGKAWIEKAAERLYWPAQRMIIESLLDGEKPLASVEKIRDIVLSALESRVEELQTGFFRHEACLSIAILHRMGLAVSRDTARSVEWLKKSLEAFDGIANNIHMGICYETGFGVPRNLLLAQSHYKKAGNHGLRHLERIQSDSAFPESEFEQSTIAVAATHLSWKDPLGLLLLYPLAEAGNAEAQFYLGEAYSAGRGVSADKQRALHWYSKAAEQDHDQATKGKSGLMTSSVLTDWSQRLELATTFQEMGDIEGACDVLREVIAAGWGQSRNTATKRLAGIEREKRAPLR
jgi:FimV-like protein